MNSDQLPIGLQKDELQESAAAGDGAARSESQVEAAHLIIDALLTALFLGEARAGNFGHPIDRRDRARVHGSLERDIKRVTDGHSSLLHRNRSQRRLNHVARGVYARHGRAEVRVHDDPPAGVALRPQPLEAETFRIRDTARGKQQRVRK